MKDVLISIKGIQDMGDSKEVMEMMTVGKLRCNGEECCLIYDENDEENDMAVTTTLKVDGHMVVTLLRTGDYSNRMTIERGQRHMSYYDMGFGELMVGVFGEDIRSSLKNSGGEISMRYTVDINSAFTSRNEITISVKEVPTHVKDS